MSSYRKGDLVTVTGQVQNVEGGYLMIALTGALDASVPAMVSNEGVKLVRASIHEQDIVEGGYRVHSFIPNTPLALLQLVDGDPADPKSFSTALRDSLTLVSVAGAAEQASAPAPAAATVSAPEPTPAPAPVSIPEAASASAAQETPKSDDKPLEVIEDKPAEAAEDKPVETPAETDQSDDATAPKPTSTLSAEMVRRPEAPPADRFGGIASDALRASQGGAQAGSIASLGVVREERNPLKPATDELLLSDEIVDDKN